MATGSERCASKQLGSHTLATAFAFFVTRYGQSPRPAMRMRTLKMNKMKVMQWTVMILVIATSKTLGHRQALQIKKES